MCMFSFKSFDMQYAPFLSFIFFVSEANLQDPPVSQSVRYLFKKNLVRTSPKRLDGLS